MHVKMSSAKCRTFCLDPNLLGLSDDTPEIIKTEPSVSMHQYVIECLVIYNPCFDVYDNVLV